MRRFRYCVSILACSVACSVAEATTLQQPTGTVLVNQGQGFKSATDGTMIKPGDRVMAPAGERIELAYSDTCKLTIEPGAVVTVPSGSPCEKTALAPPAKLGGCSLKDDPQGCDIEPERDRSHFLLGAAALGMYAGVMIWVTNDDDGASP